MDKALTIPKCTTDGLLGKKSGAYNITSGKLKVHQMKQLIVSLVDLSITHSF
jgi:hypothetical protein